jgi:hypothetical protein
MVKEALSPFHFGCQQYLLLPPAVSSGFSLQPMHAINYHIPVSQQGRRVVDVNDSHSFMPLAALPSAWTSIDQNQASDESLCPRKDRSMRAVVTLSCAWVSG